MTQITTEESVNNSFEFIKELLTIQSKHNADPKYFQVLIDFIRYDLTVTDTIE